MNEQEYKDVVRRREILVEACRSYDKNHNCLTSQCAECPIGISFEAHEDAIHEYIEEKNK